MLIASISVHSNTAANERRRSTRQSTRPVWTEDHDMEDMDDTSRLYVMRQGAQRGRVLSLYGAGRTVHIHTEILGPYRLSTPLR